MQKNKTLPILLKNQKILLIGASNVALQKAKVLFNNNIKFKIISKDINEDIYQYCNNIVKKSFKLKDIEDYKIIIDASNNTKVTNKLIKYKRKNNILLNVVDKPEFCDFYFMALTKNKTLQIAVSSNGASPTAAKYFRDECEKLIPNDINKYLQNKQDQRDNNIINIKQTKNELKIKKSNVYLVGCGLGSVELLTIQAYNIIKSVQVILYDNLISKEVIDLIPKKTKKIYVGKKKDFHSISQEKINELILKYAKKGKSVARLKSGDPFVFGRGSEELKYLLTYNINTQVIPGISSSISALTMANIPITARGYASSFTVVSAHLKGNIINLDWIDLLNKKNHTLVVLMGLSRIDLIVNEAKKHNISSELPCIIVSNASRFNQEVIKTNLKNISKDSQKAKSPAIIVFGEVSNFLN